MPEPLTFAQAAASPCEGCAAPCCTVLPLHDFTIQSLADLDYALYLLNFDGIELGAMQGGGWRVHLRRRCGQLDPETNRCRVHGTAEQPMVCKKYNEHACFYRFIFSEEGAPVVARMDRGRMRAWAEQCTFSEDRRLLSAPDQAALLQWLPPLSPLGPEAPPPPAPTLDRWRAVARGEGAEAPAEPRTWAQVQEPCGGCASWCCTRLSFPHGTPANASQLDHIRFCLGFPGVEATVDAEGAWSIDVRTRCRHLQDTEDGHRCGVFGQPERPGLCSRFDALSCAYRARYAHPRPAGLVRITGETFGAVAERFAFDDAGRVVGAPDLPAMTAAVERAWAKG